jgi:antibiotic biosynthesis monooxygenase (ABM) superfamily enzyme
VSQHEARFATAVPPFWKRWVVSMLAVYPALVALIYLMHPLLDGLPTPVSLFIIALLLTGLSTGFLAPLLHRKLAWWLRR